MKPAALGLIQNKANEILLILRKDVPVWVLPGGGIEEKETPIECVVRESFEETGIHSQNPKLIAHYLPLSRIASPLFVFSISPLSSDSWSVEHAFAEAKAIRYFPRESLPHNLFFLHKSIIEDYLSPDPKPITRQLTEITWKKAFILALSHPFYSLRYLWTRLFSQ